MARSGNYSAGFICDKRGKCEECRKRKDLMSVKVGRYSKYLCLECIQNHEDIKKIGRKNQTPQAINNSPNEGRPVRGMGTRPRPENTSNKVERDFWGRPVRR